jgi:hypothetical protein
MKTLEAWAIPSFFALLVPGCCNSSTCGCEPSQYEQQSQQTLFCRDLSASLDENGLLRPEACEQLCQVNGDVISCEIDADAGTASSCAGAVVTTAITLSCISLETAYCEGRRDAGRKRLALGTGPTPLAAWLARALHTEAASVLAFCRLRRELAAHGAPPRLCGRVLQAAAEEVAHARSMARLAAIHGGRTRRIRYESSRRVRRLVDVAHENAVEGCVNETFAALMAVHQAGAAAHEPLRNALQSIAHEEVRHAQLAWEIHAWALSKLSASERRRVHGALADAAARLIASSAAANPDEVTRRALGLPDAQRKRSLASALDEALWRGPGSPT